ncbi:hypothetical protein AVEN_239237-1 [Araneus ventricosus]|uniref:Uncharacterized protein n=1 Tax=Araneus ventricosus TaxID=182803 RepID=A0A4Y2J8F1_ARAVE|nr:hypothetical protein AVEN_239237-1 [Araneus ventricosus]
MARFLVAFKQRKFFDTPFCSPATKTIFFCGVWFQPRRPRCPGGRLSASGLESSRFETRSHQRSAVEANLVCVKSVVHIVIEGAKESVSKLHVGEIR